MAQVIYSRAAQRDLDRIIDFYLDSDARAAREVLWLIDEAIDVLGNHPYIGRPAERDLRELVISHGRSGFVAIYSIERKDDIVLVLALRHQREAGYVDDTVL